MSIGCLGVIEEARLQEMYPRQLKILDALGFDAGTGITASQLLPQLETPHGPYGVSDLLKLILGVEGVNKTYGPQVGSANNAEPAQLSIENLLVRVEELPG